jgi:uncharacterized protein (DUF2384 family)
MSAGKKKPSDATRPIAQSRLIREFLTRDGDIAYAPIVNRFGMSKRQLAETAGLRPETLRRVSRAQSARTQSRVTEMLEIVARVADWAGGEKQAMAWYRAEPIPAFGCRTAESLVKDGKAAALRDYLDALAMGAYA